MRLRYTWGISPTPRVGRARLLPEGRRGRDYAIGITADLWRSIAHVNVHFDRWTNTLLNRGRLRRFVVEGPVQCSTTRPF